jgi:hypothetical protein
MLGSHEIQLGTQARRFPRALTLTLTLFSVPGRCRVAVVLAPRLAKRAFPRFTHDGTWQAGPGMRGVGNVGNLQDSVADRG